MRSTENDLRQLLNEHAQEKSAGEPPAHLDAIVRRGRRIGRTRRAVAAGATVAVVVTAAGLMNGLLIGSPSADVATLAQSPADSAQVEPGPKLPEKFSVVLGAERFDLPLIHSQRFETMGVARTVTFSPTSFSTGQKVVCDDPQAWVVTAQRLKSGELGGSAGRCESSVSSHHDRLSAPSDWLKRPQSLQVWVFPADAPVRQVAEVVTGCPQTPVSKGCDESAQSQALMRPEVRERLSAEVGERPGRWAVGVYDRPAQTTSGPSGAPSTVVEPPDDSPMPPTP
ncbi:hypothetical protein LDL08_43060 [Nonomuraea glycinis]|uniref:Uncharacterized protein n=1 Tax=Nonomuraea glycinis TaxID=2047744 RepID=A0A918E9Q9_9ACTN|nr:hypothetical protein [Nonomuraea glycinis]MCA2182958.1 hypothetical protein [Nonomuraea glycinis]GGP17486.1 hypothetical protein GCM10012278_86090 [Nonomuraea glycinis]